MDTKWQNCKFELRGGLLATVFATDLIGNNFPIAGVIHFTTHEEIACWTSKGSRFGSHVQHDLDLMIPKQLFEPKSTPKTTFFTNHTPPTAA